MMNKLGTMVVLGLLIVSIALIPGCIERIGKPEVREISHSWGSVTHDTTEISTNVVVYNPNPVSIPFKKITLELYMNELRMATGSTEEDMEIKAEQETSILLTSYFDNGKIPDWWVTHLKKGEKSDVKIEGGVVFDLGALGEFRFPFERTQMIETNLLEKLNIEEDRTYSVRPVSLTMKSLSSSWGQVTRDS
ncbi:MAG: LEA type 2 family protein, partial [Methanocellales archaeon]|nr:LEA type 2 family protein [Methanocellales archaeon]